MRVELSTPTARRAYFRAMLSDGFQESDSECSDIQILDTSSAAFKALIKYLYTDCTEVKNAVIIDLAKLCDQYQMERVYTHCMCRLTKGITHQIAVMWRVQAHACEGGAMWAKLQSLTMAYVTRNLKEIWRDAKPTLTHLDKDHHDLFLIMLDAALRQ